MGRYGKLSIVLNEIHGNTHAVLRRAYKKRAHKAERRSIRIVLSDVRVREAQS